MHRPFVHRGSFAALTALPLALLLGCGNAVSTTPNTGGNGGAGGHTTTGSTSTAGTGGTTGCATGKVDCGAGCTDTKTDAANCGACDKPCVTGQACVAGACQCAPGEVVCGAACTDTQKDAANCGGCAKPCDAGWFCNQGACVVQCDPGQAACNNACTVLATDPKNCGACGTPCPAPVNAAATCDASACGFACLAGYRDCNVDASDGCEIDLQGDTQNCGDCGAICAPANATAACVSGGCTIGTCAAGHTDCDADVTNGCEIDTAGDPANCGGCGFACDSANHVATAACSGGLCKPTCSGPYADCNGPQAGDADDGCEVDTSSDVNNCGACGHTCAAGEKCCAGGCQDTTSCALSFGALSPKFGWQNGGDWLTITGTGFGPGVKVYLADGVAPAWAKDANTLIVQTPPHPKGLVDVKIVQGTNTLIAHGAFGYAANGLTTTWTKKAMAKVRGEIPGLAVLQNGKVLVVGGTTVPDVPGNSLNTGETYDHQADVVTPASNAMSTPRWRNSAVTLLTGKALITGGCSGCAGGNSLSADLYDPATNSFSPTAALKNAHDNIHAVLMPDGRVFLSSASTSIIELYDPIANTWTAIPHTTAHIFGFAVRLRDGRIMFGAGDSGNKVVEIFDPTTQTFTTTGSLATGRSMLTAHTLPDSRVVVIGGASSSAGGVTVPQKTMEFWSPSTGVWTTATAQLTNARCWHASALVRDGTILVMGGYPINGSCSPTAAVERFDPVAGTVTAFPALLNANTEWAAATLLDGSVIGVGGGACGTTSALPDLDFLAGAP